MYKPQKIKKVLLWWVNQYSNENDTCIKDKKLVKVHYDSRACIKRWGRL